MAKRFRLKQYDADRQKSYEFCQERKTMEADNNTAEKQLHKEFKNIFVPDKKLIARSKNCVKLDILDCCKLNEHNRTKEECRVCVGNI